MYYVREKTFDVSVFQFAENFFVAKQLRYSYKCQMEKKYSKTFFIEYVQPQSNDIGLSVQHTFQASNCIRLLAVGKKVKLN